MLFTACGTIIGCLKGIPKTMTRRRHLTLGRAIGAESFLQTGLRDDAVAAISLPLIKMEAYRGPYLEDTHLIRGPSPLPP